MNKLIKKSLMLVATIQLIALNLYSTSYAAFDLKNSTDDSLDPQRQLQFLIGLIIACGAAAILVIISVIVIIVKIKRRKNKK